MSWLLYQLVYNPACLVVPGGAWMGSCIAERGTLLRPLLVAKSRASPAKLSLQLLNLLHQLRQNSYHPHLLLQLHRLQNLNLTNSVIDTTPTTSNSLSISAASSSSTACSVLETTTTTSNSIPTISQDTTQTSKPRRKKRPPKNQSNTVKPKIEIKTAPHSPRKPAPTEYSTDEEDMMWKMNLS
ncbi:hypothetical protein TNCV_1395591 [Trichonephila clavipes]|nr:hypothetical protein TNCV_1395591 [Trichonephila clavipes]